MSHNRSAHPTQTTLPETTDHRLRLYALAASAAGVSMLALAQPAKGEVIVTEKTIPIPISSYYFPPPKPVLISLNNNSINDFYFLLYSFAYHSFRIDLTVRPLEGGAVAGSWNGKDSSSAFALRHGAKVGPSAHFSSRGQANIERAQGFDASSIYSRKLYGKWGGNADRFLGVRFLINGETHYGWVRLTVTTEPRGFSATITGYAYETIANKTIVAGPPSTAAGVQLQQNDGSLGSPVLGMLALGASGLSMWRRDETLLQ
jgi:hypothetical protein